VKIIPSKDSSRPRSARNSEKRENPACISFILTACVEVLDAKLSTAAWSGRFGAWVCMTRVGAGMLAGWSGRFGAWVCMGRVDAMMLVAALVGCARMLVVALGTALSDGVWAIEARFRVIPCVVDDTLWVFLSLAVSLSLK